MDWDQLPDPTHLSRVLDTDTFLGTKAALSGARYVQVGAYRSRAEAQAQMDRITATGLRAVAGQQGGLVLVLMPESERNTASTLAGWAKRSGYPDAYIREIR